MKGHSAQEANVCKADWEAWSQLPQAEQKEGEEDYPKWTMPEPTISEGFAGEMASKEYPMGFAIPHVAPDDPCPCGSGLRYSRCHGKYLS